MTKIGTKMEGTVKMFGNMLILPKQKPTTQLVISLQSPVAKAKHLSHNPLPGIHDALQSPELSRPPQEPRGPRLIKVLTL